MLTRLARVRSFALHETMVPGGCGVGRRAGRHRATTSPRGRPSCVPASGRSSRGWPGPKAVGRRCRTRHRRLAFLRLRFNAVLSHFDVFSIGDDAAERARNRRVAVGARRRGARRARAQRERYPIAADRLLSRPRLRCRDPARADAAARRRRNTGRDRARAARAHGRQRHRVVARARGRAPGRRAPRPRRPAARLPPARGAARDGRCATRGACGSAGSPRSSPTSGRSRTSASGRRSA